MDINPTEKAAELSESCGGVVLGPDNRVVVVSQGGTSWSLPKGHVEPGESLEVTARREIMEETGLTHLELIRELGSYRRYGIALDGGDDRRYLKTIHMFLFRTNQKALQPLDCDNPEAVWIEIGQVCAKLTHYKDREFFESIQKWL